MKAGMIGLGKLGLPCALAMESRGHTLCGYDVMPEPREYLKTRKIPYLEEGTPELLKEHNLHHTNSIAEVVAGSQIVFVAVQTPHSEGYEGITPLPSARRDFEYQYLISAVREACQAANSLRKHISLVIISTVLPGTTDKVLRPLLNKYVSIVYNPFFIAMGRTVYDFLNPEFVLLGADTPPTEVIEFYSQIHNKPTVNVSVPSAELLKVSYNTFIGLKIIFANSLMEICHHTGADVDQVTDGLAQATHRVISPKYLHAGMGDGGGCHPRDNIALSHLAKSLNLSVDLFEIIMDTRERQSKWLAEYTAHWSRLTKLPIVLMGVSFKAETNLTVGSPALLLKHQLDRLPLGVSRSLGPPRSGSRSIVELWGP